MKLLFFVVFAVWNFSANAETLFHVGQREYTFQDTSRNRILKTRIWYPISTKVKTSVVGKGLFVPVIAAVNAEIEKTDKPFPVVLISHGSGGTAEKLFWLAGYLVEHGFVAVGVDSPGNMTRDNNGVGVVSQWVRALDSTFVLNRVDELKEFKGRLDFSKVGAAGHSSGGTTVLLLAGARLSSDRLANATPKCGGSKDPYAEKSCKEMKAINYKSFPKDVVEKDYTDPRVKAVVSLDPGLQVSFDPASFKALKAKTLIIAAEKLAAPQEEIFSKDFAKLVSKNEFEILPGSYHMTFLQACKPGIPFDDPELEVLCANGEKKLQLQQEVREKTLKFFQANLYSDKKYEIVNFPNGKLQLSGELFRPEGKGPFPVVLYNHGSAEGMLSDQASTAVGPRFVEKGWIFFMPYRRGQGLSAKAGPYINAEIAKAQKAGGLPLAVRTMIDLLTNDHLSDQLAALEWIRKQKFVQKERIAVAGQSFGGIQSILGAQKYSYCAAVDASGASMSWKEAPELQELMKKSVRESKAPIFFFQAENDYTLDPSRTLYKEMTAAGKKAEIKIYPPFGKTPFDGHSFTWLGSSLWFEDVFMFIQKNCGTN